MMGVRKLLDFTFTRNELKILDDILPEHKRTERLDDIEEAEEEQKAAARLQEESGRRASIKYTDSGLELPLANGNVMKIPASEIAPDINISEEVNKCGVWKNLEATNSNPKIEDVAKKSSGGGWVESTTRYFYPLGA